MLQPILQLSFLFFFFPQELIRWSYYYIINHKYEVWYGKPCLGKTAASWIVWFFEVEWKIVPLTKKWGSSFGFMQVPTCCPRCCCLTSPTHHQSEWMPPLPPPRRWGKSQQGEVFISHVWTWNEAQILVQSKLSNNKIFYCCVDNSIKIN